MDGAADRRVPTIAHPSTTPVIPAQERPYRV